MYTMIATAKLNDVDPQAWLADVLTRIAETPQMVQSCRRNGRMRYGPGSPWERHDDSGGPSSDTT